MVWTEVGSRVDHYQIERLVARSATSSIYRAIDLNTGRHVALKVPHPEVEGDPLFYSRLCREREIGRKLDHPSIVKAIAEDNSSRVYLATEWVEGQPLRKILSDQGKLAPQRAIKIALAVADALEYIHSEGIVHRDLKPENIVVDGEDRIKLIDFGIASQTGARRLTFGKLSEIMGSPDYISPEQVKGKRGDARSDIYALGVMLYEMLTGMTPFTGNNPFAIMNSRLVNRPVPPREVDPAISPQVQEIVCRALEPDPKYRYGSARQLSWDLRHRDQVRIPDRPVFGNRRRRPNPSANPVVLYGMLAMIPVVIFALLLYVARQS